MKEFITDEMKEAFASRSWTLLDFCRRYDCTAQVFLQLCKYHRGGASDMLSPEEFLFGFIHDEMSGDIEGFRYKSLAIQECNGAFYKEGASVGIGLNDVVLRKVLSLLGPSDSAYVRFDDVVFVRIFSYTKLLGTNKPKGFAALRAAGASQELIDKGKKLASLQYTIGNITALPRKCVKSDYMLKYLSERYHDRFDLFLGDLLKVLPCYESADCHLAELCRANSWFFADGANAFLARHFLREFESDMGNAYGMEVFSKEDCKSDPAGYLSNAAQYIDAAVNAIENRSKRIIERIKLQLKSQSRSEA